MEEEVIPEDESTKKSNLYQQFNNNFKKIFNTV